MPIEASPPNRNNAPNRRRMASLLGRVAVPSAAALVPRNVTPPKGRNCAAMDLPNPSRTAPQPHKTTPTPTPVQYASGATGLDCDELHLDLTNLGVEPLPLDELDHFAEHLVA